MPDDCKLSCHLFDIIGKNRRKVCFFKGLATPLEKVTVCPLKTSNNDDHINPFMQKEGRKTNA